VRTGVDAVDTLTVIAHDRFDEVIRAARDPNSIIAHQEGRHGWAEWRRVAGWCHRA
jgi:hypothetical protein